MFQATRSSWIELYINNYLFGFILCLKISINVVTVIQNGCNKIFKQQKDRFEQQFKYWRRC